MRGIKEKKPKKMKIRTSRKLDKFFPDFKNFDKIIAEKREKIKALREKTKLLMILFQCIKDLMMKSRSLIVFLKKNKELLGVRYNMKTNILVYIKHK